MSGETDDGTPRSSLSPAWSRPKSPLPPHRLAKLANALGVSTPIPANHNSSSFLSRSFSESAGSNDHFRRSPTPSVTSAMGFHSQQPTSKFLLHVIPPHHLPHDSNNSNAIHTNPSPPNAPGYHLHFRRGTLVPVYPTLQAQLGAIAKEYALPSTTGLILYMILTPTTDSSSQPPDEMDEPGPRLSEDIWKHIWTRVLRIEQRDDLSMPSLAPSPNFTPQLLSLKSATRSTPFLPQESSGFLRPFIASQGPDPLQPYAPPSPSTTSSLSDIRSMNKSVTPSSESISPSEPDTEDTSVDDSAMRANSFDLPGLTSPSLIPILAKVEFDIDCRKAGWYAPWIRSRNANHAKRSKSREQNPDDEPSDHVPIELLTGKKEKLKRLSMISIQDEILEEDDVTNYLKRLSRTSVQDEALEGDEQDVILEDDDVTGYLKRLSRASVQDEALEGDEIAGYAPLSESPEGTDSDSDSANGEDYSEDATARVPSLTGGKDPLDDVFGTDADTWADIRASNAGESESKNPHIVQLALTGAELAALPSQETFDDDDDISTPEEDEVRELLDLMSKPNLVVSIPSPPLSSPQTGIRKEPPPPLVLVPKDKGGPVISATPSLSSLPSALSSNSASLAYLTEEEDNDPAEEDYDFARIRSPEESEKRGGAVFDDLDLGLDPTEDFDDSDPNDRRRSQFLMMAQLDEIERTMAHLSPRMLSTAIEDEQNTSFSSVTLSPNSPGQFSLSPSRTSGYPSPRLPQIPPDSPDSIMNFAGQSWPAVPFASIKDNRTNYEGKPDRPSSPPSLAVNGVSTSAPRSYMPTNRLAIDPQSETGRRKKELEDEQALYPPIPPPKHDKELPSPILPLSPDPFGRFPSVAESSTSAPVGAQWTVNSAVHSAPSTRQEVASEESQAESQSLPTTSRFSSDSVTGEELANIVKTSNRATLISVKSFKKLWRKSDSKKSISSISPTTLSVTTMSAPSSGRSSPMPPPPRPERPPEDQLDLPDVPDMPHTRLSPQLISSQPPPREHMHTSRRPSQDQHIARLSPQPTSSQLPSREHMHTSRRPSQDQHIAMPPSRPSLDQLSPPIQHVHSNQFSAPLHPGISSQPPPREHMHTSRRPSQDQHIAMPHSSRPSLDQLSPPIQLVHSNQFSAPLHPGINRNGPMMTAHPQHLKASNLDRLHFDQESPYPVRRSPPVRRPPSPPSIPPLPPIPEQEKPTTRKSILKWKSSTNHATHPSVSHTSEAQPRSSFERPGGASNPRNRRPSVINFGSTRASVTSPDPLPPSPQIPEHFINNNNRSGVERQQSQKSNLAASPTELYSPPLRQPSLGTLPLPSPRSMASSSDSEKEEPSFDTSQFEIVSPKPGGSLSYPYNALDQ